MKKPFMAYYEHIAKLSVIANKQTLFLSHLLCRMEFKDGQLVVDMNAKVKREIMRALGGRSKDPLRLASQYLIKLQRAGLCKSLGEGRYQINPTCYSYGRYVSKDLRDKAGTIFLHTKYSDNGRLSSSVTVDTKTGEVIKV